MLDRLRQEGCLKARLPRSNHCEVVTLNSSGGIAGGDRLATTIAFGPHTAALVATQAAERIYRALPDSLPAELRTSVTVDTGAAAEWLPQETILFDAAALDRRLDIRLAANASFLGLEMLVFGRTASDETVHTALLHDTIRVYREDRLVLHDAIRIDGPVAAHLARPAVARGARAVATLLRVAPDCERDLDALRAALAGTDSGASAWNGMLLARILAPDGATLRRAVIAGLQVLRRGATLPRVWMC